MKVFHMLYPSLSQIRVQLDCILDTASVCSISKFSHFFTMIHLPRMELHVTGIDRNDVAVNLDQQRA